MLGVCTVGSHWPGRRRCRKWPEFSSQARSALSSQFRLFRFSCCWTSTEATNGLLGMEERKGGSRWVGYLWIARPCEPTGRQRPKRPSATPRKINVTDVETPPASGEAACVLCNYVYCNYLYCNYFSVLCGSLLFQQLCRRKSQRQSPGRKATVEQLQQQGNPSLPAMPRAQFHVRAVTSLRSDPAPRLSSLAVPVSM